MQRRSENEEEGQLHPTANDKRLYQEQAIKYRRYGFLLYLLLFNILPKSLIL
jgi:hypothetical protein